MKTIRLSPSLLCCPPKTFWSLFALLSIFSFTKISAQNIVDQASTNLAANPAKLTETDFSEFILYTPVFKPFSHNPGASRVAAKLEAHVSQFLDGFPWKAFQHTMGISAYEVYFDHPDELFYSLSRARPYLSSLTASRSKILLASLLSNSPPWSMEGFDRTIGQSRESYDIPPNLRLGGRGSASSAFGVYAFWLYCQVFEDSAAVRKNWGSIRERMQPLLSGSYKFDVQKKNYSRDEAAKLNGDLAGLLGLVRLARWASDPSTEKLARAKAANLLQLRVDLERINPQIVEKSGGSSKNLHYYKLSRYCDLVPEVAEAIRKLSAGCGQARLRTFREERNAWYMAYGDRFIGGENYTSPADFARALFAGAALVEQLPASQLLNFVDVPWCKGDLFFIEKCSYALWSADGRASRKSP